MHIASPDELQRVALTVKRALAPQGPAVSFGEQFVRVKLRSDGSTLTLKTMKRGSELTVVVQESVAWISGGPDIEEPAREVMSTVMAALSRRWDVEEYVERSEPRIAAKKVDAAPFDYQAYLQALRNEAVHGEIRQAIQRGAVNDVLLGVGPLSLADRSSPVAQDPSMVLHHLHAIVADGEADCDLIHRALTEWPPTPERLPLLVDYCWSWARYWPIGQLLELDALERWHAIRDTGALSACAMDLRGMTEPLDALFAFVDEPVPDDEARDWFVLAHVAYSGQPSTHYVLTQFLNHQLHDFRPVVEVVERWKQRGSLRQSDHTLAISRVGSRIAAACDLPSVIDQLRPQAEAQAEFFERYSTILLSQWRLHADGA